MALAEQVTLQKSYGNTPEKAKIPDEAGILLQI
ncbi:hypothetical protein FHW02_002078 [Ochrobactrum sp. RH1CCR137]|nr:hypothetical protein [Ochrobactrum sp. RH1CCR137]